MGFSCSAFIINTFQLILPTLLLISCWLIEIGGGKGKWSDAWMMEKEEK
jgi:hypothetical protein